MPGWHTVILLAVVVVPVAVAILLFLWTRPRSGSEPGALSRMERGVVSLVGGGAVAGIPLSIYGIIASGVGLATAPTVTVTGIVLSNSSYPPFLVASDAPVDAGYESAWVEVANLPGSTRFLLWGESALPLLIGLTISVAVAWLALALLRGSPFTRAFPIVLGVVAVVLVGAGLGIQLVGAIARAETVAFLGPPELITGHDDGSGAVEGFVAHSSVVDLGPIGWGLGIALVAAAFSIGTRLQRETRGLV